MLLRFTCTPSIAPHCCTLPWRTQSWEQTSTKKESTTAKPPALYSLISPYIFTVPRKCWKRGGVEGKHLQIASLNSTPIQCPPRNKFKSSKQTAMQLGFHGQRHRRRRRRRRRPSIRNEEDSSNNFIQFMSSIELDASHLYTNYSKTPTQGCNPGLRFFPIRALDRTGQTVPSASQPYSKKWTVR
jgi:hypothetical protein